MAIVNMPSPWAKMTVEQMKEVKDRYKLQNDIAEQAHREEEIAKKAQEQQATTQMEAMKDTLPYLKP